ncbi:MAG: heparinase II/III family protein [Rhodospirillales bacterium]|nr:heparinase II/III family protein [Rhodospirillales bacterium]
MFKNFLRKTRQIADDPVLRQWLVRRLTLRASAPALFTAHRPPYLDGFSVSASSPSITPGDFRPLAATLPKGAIELPLAGLTLKLDPGDEKEVFQRSYKDIETLLALHRFAWLPLRGGEAAQNWAQALWNVWRESFGELGDGWAWHPYTAAERAINILDLAETQGLPEPVDDTLAVLARHAEAIFQRLEYFGDHDTSNHLSNNGRGLYRLGLALDLDWATEAGARILEQESKRILLTSGVLREGSSHYHLLITRNYVDAWLAARRHGRAEEPGLRDIASRALAVVPWLVLPGGMPLVGDISPDCSPEHLLGLTGANIGWVAGLCEDDRSAVLALIDDVRPVDAEQLASDGWHRLSSGPWTGLWHCAPKGWAEAPGHGHQDTGGFELHFNDIPLLVDPGRGAYGEDGEAARYRSAEVHNTLTVSGCEPYPVNKPYYDDAFRTTITGAQPVVTSGGDEVRLEHFGFQRLTGVGALSRQWRFTEKTMSLSDSLQGRGTRRITRRFMTPLKAEAGAGAGGIVLTHNGSGGTQSFLLHSPDAVAVVSKTTLWQAYGRGREGFAITFSTEAPLPWSGEIRLEAI